MESADPDLSELDAVLADFTSRLRLGDSPIIDEYLSRYPAMADDLRDLLPVIAATEGSKSERITGRDRNAETPSLRPTADTWTTEGRRPSAEAIAFLDAIFAPPQNPDEIGRIGNYRVLELLGRGGMGAVFLAEDARLHRRVALKVMLPGIADQDGASERFLREARAAAALDHDNIVTIYQVDEDRGIPFIAMALLQGCALEDRLMVGPPLSPYEIAKIARQAASGLAAAHARGIVHRDVKPGNIWLEQKDEGGRMKEEKVSSSIILPPSSFTRIKLLDFGLARPVEPNAGVTQSGVVVGTPSYMSPEQARGETVDGRADLFSLGVVLYRLATGTLPFQGASAAAVFMSLASSQPPPPTTLNPKIPKSLSDAIMELLAKNATDRPASALDAAHHFESIESELAGGEKTEVFPQPKPRRRFSTKPIAAVALAALIPLIALTVYLTIQTRDGTLHLKIHDDDLVVSVHDGTTTVFDKSTKRSFSMRPQKGEIHVFDKDADRPLVTKQFELRKGETTTLEVSAAEIAAARETIKPTPKSKVDPPKTPDDPPSDEVPAHLASLPWTPMLDRWPGGWVMHSYLPGDWTMDGDTLVGKGRRGWLYTNRTDYGDFYLRAEFRTTLNCDSGIFFWTPFALDRYPDGVLNPPYWHEVNIADDGVWSLTGTINGQGKVADVKMPPEGLNWTTLEILAVGKRVVSKVNGRVVASLTFPEPKTGTIALQTPINPQSTIWFRKLEIKAPPSPSTKTPAPAPSGWTSLFNTKDLTGWKPRMTGQWFVKNNLLTGSAKKGEFGMLDYTPRDYSDFHLHAEARLTGAGNGGIYFRDMYQAEIDAEYFGSLSRLAPWAWLHHDKNKLVELGQWFNIDVIADGPRLKTIVNGKTVAMVEDATKTRGPIGLEIDGRVGDGTTVEFRKIEVKELTSTGPPVKNPPPPNLPNLAIASQLVAQTDKAWPKLPADYRDLFDGKSLAGWRPRKWSTPAASQPLTPEETKVWQVEAGSLVGKNSGDIWLATIPEFKTFVLVAEWRLTGKGDSGLFLFSRDLTRDTIEIDLQAPRPTGFNTTGAILISPHKLDQSTVVQCDIAAVKAAARPPGEWNVTTVACTPTAIVVSLNGTIIQRADAANSPALLKAMADAGPIGLQIFGERVEFRRVAIKPLDR